MPSTRSRPALHYIQAGQGPPLIFSHALGCNLRMWDGVARAFEPTHTVVCYDTRCHGQSEVMAAPTSMSDLVSDAVRLIDELDCESVTWVGLSMGGMIGQGLAIAHPERVERLVLANTTSRYPADARPLWAERARIARADGMHALAALIMSRYFSPMFLASRPDIVEMFRQDVLSVDPLGYAACCEAIESLDYHAGLRRIVCPTLVIAGGADAAASPAVPQEIAEQIPGASLAVMETAGHLSAVEQPEEFVRLLRAFL